MGLAWGEHLATGIDTIDDQHRELFGRLNDFLAACDSGQGKEELLGMLQFLDDYVVFHFRAEELIHEEYDYPDRARHRQYHRMFIDRLTSLKRRFLVEGPTIDLVAEINRFTIGWLIDHIGDKDREFARTVLQKQ
jgi:hemerythrin